MRRRDLRLAVSIHALILLGSVGGVHASQPGGPADAVFFVATAGNDAWSGRLTEPNAAGTDGPWSSLGRARDEIRKMKRARRLPAGGVTVFVRGGTYRLTETFALGPEDSGTAQSPVVYRSWQEEKPILNGAYKVAGFQPYRGQIFQCDLRGKPVEGVVFRQLFFQGKRMVMARYPNADPQDPHCGTWAYVLDVDGTGVRDHFTTTNDVALRMNHWTRLGHAEICIHPSYGWGWNILAVKSTTPEEATIRLTRKTSYDIRIGDRYYAQNVLEELDAPGEWYLDRDAARLYFWPPADLAANEPLAPLVKTLIAMKGASHLTVRGFTLEDCDGDAVQIQDCENCLVAQSTIRNCGAWGVWIAGGRRSGAAGNDIYATGAGGVSVNGGSYKTLERGDNFATNNYIHHIAEFQKIYHAGVNIAGVGNTASHNLIHDTYHAGILLGGNENTVEYNLVHHNNLGVEDTGGLYMSSRDWSKRGCVIRHNIFHHCGGFGKVNSSNPVRNGKVEYQYPFYSWAIYLDCPTTGNLVYGNVICASHICVLFNASGLDYTWENNIIVDCPVFQAYTMGDAWECWPDMFKKLKEAQRPGSPYLKLYPMLADYDETRPGAMRNVRFLRNIMYYTEEGSRWLREKQKTRWQGRQLLYEFRTHEDDFAKNEFDGNTVYAPPSVDLLIRFQLAPEPLKALDWKQWRAQGVDKNSVMADPLFVNPAGHDYRLKAESPALKLGFKPIPFEKIGPYRDALRASWPVVEAPGVAALGDFKTLRSFQLPGYEPEPAREFAPRGGVGNFFAKIAAKQPVKVAVFAGGSHAQGGWRAGVMKWLRERYPDVAMTDLDASIPGCVRGSAFSVYRFAREVLRWKPDLVVVDFAADDTEASAEPIWATAEAVVRQAWKADPKIDLLFVYAFKPGFEQSYATGATPSPVFAYEKVANHYGIPSINMGYRVAQMAKEGTLVFKASAQEAKALKGKIVFTHDGTSTSAAANALYAQVVTQSLAKLADGAMAKPHQLKRAFRKHNLERARLVPIVPKMLTGAWSRMAPDSMGGGLGRHFDEVWFTNAPGAKLTFRFRGTAVSLFDLLGPDTGRARIVLDGQERGVRERVDPWCYYQRMSALTVADNLDDKEHTVTVELMPDSPNRKPAIEAAKRIGRFKPKDFEGVAFRFGWIRIVGEPLE